MIADPYHVPVLRKYNSQKLRDDVRKEMSVHDENVIALSRPDSNPYTNLESAGSLVRDGYAIELVLPGAGFAPFIHPLVIKHAQRTPEVTIAVDGRSFVRRPKRNENVLGTLDNNSEFIVQSRHDFRFQVGRALLTGVALTSDPMALLSLTDLPIRTFGYWLSSAISRPLALNGEEQMTLLGICAYYYVSLFHTEESFTEDEQARAVLRINRMYSNLVKVPAGLGYLANLEDFCKAVQIGTNNAIRLDGLSPQFVIEQTGPTWRGRSSFETVAVALEHPPTWLAIVEQCVTHPFFKKSLLGSTVENLARRQNAGQEFLKKLAVLPY